MPAPVARVFNHPDTPTLTGAQILDSDLRFVLDISNTTDDPTGTISKITFGEEKIALGIPTMQSDISGIKTKTDFITVTSSVNLNTVATLAGSALQSINGIVAGGELGGTYPNPTLNNGAVISKVLSGFSLTGGAVSAADTILVAFGKVQSQLNAMVGGVSYQGTWNASTNSPALTSSTGTKGHYYTVNVPGATNLNGITDWKTNDTVIFNGTIWEKIDNTDSVVSVNGQAGAVTLTTADIGELTNLYYTNTRGISSILTGYVSGAGVISSSDTILGAIQKLNGNVASIVSNATHTGEVTGATSLTLDKVAITNKTTVTAVGTDFVLISDTSDSGNLKKALVSDLVGAGGAVTSVNSLTGTVVLTTTNIAEGSGLYFTNARAIGATLTGYTSGAGTVTSGDSILSAIQKINGNIVALTTSSVAEGTNLYYTQARFDSAFTAKSTTNLTEGSNLYFTTARTLATTLSGLSISGSSITAADTILVAFGKVQSQINALVGGVIYQGTWNANTNSPSLSSGVGTKGHYYTIAVAGSTTLNGISDWKINDTAIYNGTAWEKIDNTDNVVTVNGQVGTVVLTTTNISEGSNLYYTNARAIAATLTGYVSGAGSVSSSDTILGAIQKLNGNIGAITSNATHTGEVTGATALTVHTTAITNKTAGTPVSGDYLLYYETSGGVLKKSLISSLPSGGGATISDAVYGAGWNGNTTDGASKNALYDEFQNRLPVTTYNKTIIYQISNWSIMPDSSGNCFLEPASIKQTNDRYNIMRIILKDSGTKTGFGLSFIVPSDYVGTAYIGIVWGSNATSGNNVVFDVDYKSSALSATLDPSSDDENATATAADSTTSQMGVVTEIALTSSNLGAGERFDCNIMRDGASGSDTLASDLYIAAIYLKYNNY